MIFELVYADANLFAGVQGSCTCHCPGKVCPHGARRTELPVLVRMIPGSAKGTRGTRSRNVHYLKPYEPCEGDDWVDELGVEAHVLSPINSLLFVNKQAYLETLPHLYLNTTFFFDYWQDAHKFAATVGHANLRLVRSVEMFSDHHRLDYSDIKLSSFIVAHMPNIEHLTVSFWEEHIRLEADEDYYTSSRCDKLETALLQFASLKHLRQIQVNVLSEVGRRSWACEKGFSTVTEKAVEDMIRTGDRGVLDRAREGVLRQEGRDIVLQAFDELLETNIIDDSGLSGEWWMKRLGL
jgi:hypothetical protein